MFNYNHNYSYFYTFIWFPVFQSNMNNFKTDLFSSLIGP